MQTWFPLTLRVGLNGRSWLYQQLQREGIRYRCCDNILLEVADWSRAVTLGDAQYRWLSRTLTKSKPRYVHDEGSRG